MSTLDDLLQAGACAQARAVARGEITAHALWRAQYERIRAQDPALHAYIALAPEPAPPPVTPTGSALAGSTFAAKDNFDVAGLPTAAGLRALARPATHDAAIVARLRAAGMHCLGKLNMHAAALGASNHNPDYGDCINPRRAGHTAGGSSGGSAAAVAAGLCGIALGSDTMGSVRIPAAYCGVVGFKPSHETLGLDGMVTLCRLLDHAGLLARCVEDIVAAMRVTAPHAPEAPPRVTPWRVGVVIDGPDHGATPAVWTAYEAALDRLRGHDALQIEPVRIGRLDLGAIRRAGLLLCEAELYDLLGPLLAERPDAVPADLRAMLRYVEGKHAIDMGRALATVARAGEWLDVLCTPYDAVLLPTAPQTAFRMDEPVPANQADFTALANMNGAPAISLPLPVPQEALPVGLQAIGHRGHDHALLQLARELEAALAA
jgi:Asp-tRNA(Asn)/Glu-tRNA(Gln) amidotransferase A subunit family amidase